MQVYTVLDWITLVLFFIGLGYIIWSVINQKQDSPEQYFLAGRNLGWFVIGASIFASNIGSEHIVGWLEHCKQWYGMGHYELHS